MVLVCRKSGFIAIAGEVFPRQGLEVFRLTFTNSSQFMLDSLMRRERFPAIDNTMNKLPLLLITAGLLLPVPSELLAFDDETEKTEYRFEYKVAKKRAHEDRKEKKAKSREPGAAETEMWLYKVEVENKSLSDTEELDVQYTLYLTPAKSSGGRGGPGGGGGGGRPGGGGPPDEDAGPRTVTGEVTLDPIERGDEAVFETIASAVSKASKQRGGPPGGGRGGPGGGGQGGGGQGGGGPEGETAAEKLDGIKIEIYQDGEKVGEHLYGNAAKRIAAAEKKSLRKAEREDRENRDEDED